MDFTKDQLDEIQFMMYRFRDLNSMVPEDAYKDIVETIDTFLQRPDYKEQLTCGSVKNCSMCCHDSIPMGMVEGRIMKKFIVDNNIPFNKERVILQNNNALLKWEDKACPLLGDEVDGTRLCTIYENRPLICRTHNSGSHPSVCLPDNELNKVEVMISAVMALTFIAYDLESPRAEGEVPELTNMHEILKDL